MRAIARAAGSSAALGVLVLTLLGGAGAGVAAAQQPTVHAVLFFSPTCPHCERVIQNVLPGIFAHFGGTPQFHPGTAGHLLTNGRLEILLVDATQPEGQAVYRTSTLEQNVSPERQGVPRLVCGDSVLVGELEIPDRFPGMITAGLAHGGVPWPAIAGLASVFPPGYALARSADSSKTAQAPAATPSPRLTATRPAAPAATATPPADAAAESSPASQPSEAAAATALVSHTTEPALRHTLRTDPVGGSLAIAMLAVMVLSLAMMLSRVPASVPRAWEHAVPWVVVLGMAVAGYLAYVESTGAVAVCGPVGDCNAVQQSRYAHLWGIPIAVLGLAGYVAILGAWLGGRAGPEPIRPWLAIAAFALSVIGTAASLVLTILEPFTIGAVCAWCLSSALAMTVLPWLLARPAADAAAQLRRSQPAGRRVPAP